MNTTDAEIIESLLRTQRREKALRARLEDHGLLLPVLPHELLIKGEDALREYRRVRATRPLDYRPHFDPWPIQFPAT